MHLQIWEASNHVLGYLILKLKKKDFTACLLEFILLYPWKNNTRDNLCFAELYHVAVAQLFNAQKTTRCQLSALILFKSFTGHQVEETRLDPF